MAITTSNIRNTYTANVNQTDFTYTFELFDEDEIEVYVDDVLQMLTTDYTVSGVGNDNGGTVILVTALNGGESVVLLRNTATTRATDFQQNGKWLAATTNTEFDRVWAKIQETEGNSSTARVIKLQDTDVDANLDLPLKTARSNKFIGFDDTGDIAVRGAIGSSKGNWTTSTAYVFGDIIIDGVNSNNTGNVYFATTNHTSGTFSTDLSAGKLQLILDVVAIQNGVINSIDEDLRKIATSVVLRYN